jgi:glycosyltransferase involved in cell wall biosynthesis
MNILNTETLKKWGGQQNRVLSEAVGLQKRGHHVIIACHIGSVLAQKAKSAGIKVFELNMVKQAHLVTVPKLINIIKTENIEIVSTHSSVDSWAGGIAAKLTGRNLVRFRHNLYPVGKDPLTKLIYSMPDRIIAISDTVKDVLVQHGLKQEKLMVIPDAVDTGVFSPEADDIREELEISPDALVIGNTSTFTEVKGQEYLLQAFNVISQKVSCILLFAGRLIEPAKSRYLSYVNPEFRNKVIFLGHRDDVQQVLKTINIFVYPSFLEGLGTALLEAMAMERPVAVSDIPTFRNFITDGENGVFFKARNNEALSEKIISIINNRDLMYSIGKKARLTIIDKFGLNKMIDDTENCYMSILNSSK